MTGFALGRIEGVRAVAPRRPDLNRLADAQAAEKTKVRARSREEGSLTITTAEGDKVTLSFRNTQSVRASEARLYGPNGLFARAQVKGRESREIGVSLEGNLSEQEMADITALVGQLTGQGEAGELRSLASYDFRYQWTEDFRLKATRVSLLA
jgi:hypothetical protein